MKNLTITTAILMGNVLCSNAQVAENTDGSLPDAPAMMDLKSSAQGFLPLK